MSWGSLEAFLAMGGHGLYVWGSYAMALACVVIEVLAVRRAARRGAP